MCYFNKTIVAAAVAVALATSTAFAQDGFRDAGAKMRGDFGNSSRASAQSSGARYRSSAPLAVRNEPAPSRVAEAPQSTRSYSYEPSTSGSGGGCCPATNVAPAPAQAQRGGYRSYSYEAPMGSYRSWSRRSQSPGMRDATSKARGEY